MAALRMGIDNGRRQETRLGHHTAEAWVGDWVVRATIHATRIKEYNMTLIRYYLGSMVIVLVETYSDTGEVRGQYGGDAVRARERVLREEGILL